MERKINVTVRVKPLSEKEKKNEKNHLWQVASDSSILNTRTNEMYTFDRVYPGTCNTAEVFDTSVKSVVNAAMNGINQTVFAYGQTSSGKTHTMKGYEEGELGLIPLSVTEIFERAQDKEVDICCSYIEIYNESVNDLLDAANKNLDIRESIARGIYINKLSDVDTGVLAEIITDGLAHMRETYETWDE